MCRMLLYKGKQPIQLAHLLTKPAHSIINQSFDSRLRIDDRRPINGDGFGVGWYESVPDPEIGEAPCIFTSVTPAWNNMNLVRLADKIKSPLVFAHVRASTAGAVSESNCHPWQYGRLMFMHNGNIADFNKFKRKVQESLTDEIFLSVDGNTDSQWAFAVFLSQLTTPLQREPFCQHELKEAMTRTIARLNQWGREVGTEDPSMMNFAVTDGVTVVCTRYISSRTLQAASLYYSSGTRFESYEPGHYRMVKADKREDMVVISSEPLTFEKADWLTIPSNTLVVISSKMNVLMYPIVDEFYNPSQHERIVGLSHSIPHLDLNDNNKEVPSLKEGISPSDTEMSTSLTSPLSPSLSTAPSLLSSSSSSTSLSDSTKYEPSSPSISTLSVGSLSHTMDLIMHEDEHDPSRKKRLRDEGENRRVGGCDSDQEIDEDYRILPLSKYTTKDRQRRLWTDPSQGASFRT